MSTIWPEVCGHLCLHTFVYFWSGAGFHGLGPGPSFPSQENLIATACNDILDNGVLPALWPQPWVGGGGFDVTMPPHAMSP